jgi:hypothetical protein
VKSKVVPANKHVSSLKEISIKKNYVIKRVSDSYNYKNIYDDGKNSHQATNTSETILRNNSLSKY